MATRRFGTLTLVCLVVANMVGAGVFTTSGFALADLGTPARVLAAWALGGAIAVCGALSYGALARHLPESGGEYLFLSRVLHPAAGFVAGWVSLLAGFTGAIAFAASALEAYALPAEVRPDWLPADALAIGVIVTAALLHAQAARVGALTQNLLVAAKLVLLVGIVAVAVPPSLARGPAGPADPAAFEWGAFALSLMWVSLSYSGFNAAVYVAGEARDAARSVPRALLIGTVLVVLIYLALNAAFLWAVPSAAIAGQADVAARSLSVLAGDGAGALVRVAVVIALATSVSSMMMAGPRVYARMAEDGVLPAALRLHDESPRAAIALQAGLAAAVVLAAGLGELLSWLGFTLSVSAALTVASLFVLRHREGVEAVPVPGWPWVPGFFVAASVLIAVTAAARRPLEPLVGLATLGVGLLAWGWTRRRRARVSGGPAAGSRPGGRDR